MTARWALIRAGAINTVVEQDDAPELEGHWVEVVGVYGPGDLYDGEDFSRVGDARPRHITPRAFRARFTPQERAAIEFAATDDPNASQEDRLAAAGLRADLRETDASNYIDLGLVKSTNRLAPLVVLGVLAAGRPDEITDAIVQDSERP